MRISYFLVFFAAFQLTAAVPSKSQITLKMENTSIKEVFDAISAQSDKLFFYSDSEIDLQKTVSVDANNKSIESILNQILNENGEFDFEIMDDYIVIMPKKEIPEVITELVAIEIHGVITDNTGVPLPGATVMERGTTNGVITDVDGKYKITVTTKDAYLAVSFLGYEKQEVEILGRKEINIVLLETAATLDEVVITGVFARKAESFAGSAVTIKADDLKRVGNSNVFQSLKNLDPSLNIMSNFLAGSDPNKLPDMQLRGTSSLPGEIGHSDLRGNYANNPNQPLFILDGFEASPTRIFDLDQDRVRSITILKDAAAKAIYGAKAANGVIVIELKRPQMGEFRFTYRSALDIQAPDLTSYDLTNAMEKLEVEKIAGLYTADIASMERQLELDNLYNYRYKKSFEGDDTYWLSKPLRTGIGNKQSISIEMGTEKAQYIADFTYNKVSGVMKGSGRTNISGSVSVQYRMKNLLFRNVMSITSNNSSDSPYGSFNDYARMNPYWDAYNEDGTVATGAGTIDEYINPLHNSTLATSFTSSYFDFTNNFYTEWKPTKELTAIARVGISHKRSSADDFYPSDHTRFINFTGDDVYRKGFYQLNQGRSSSIKGDLSLRYAKEVNKHFIMASGWLNINESNNYEVVNYAEGFPGDRMTDIAFALQYAFNKTPFTYENTTRGMGFTGQFGYTYDDRFLSDVTIRKSASSQFGAKKRWGTFWSASLGWNMHKENFLKSYDWIKKLKLRTSVGTTGNQNFASYQAIPTYNYRLDRVYDRKFGVYIPSLANEDLQWQRKLDYNMGLELHIGRLSATLDYYISYTDNLITDLSIAPSYGYGSMKANVGKVKNSGIDLNFSYNILKGTNGFLNFTAAVVSNTNKIVDLSDAMEKFNADQDKRVASSVNGGLGIPLSRYVEGGSVNSIWAVPSLGIDPATGAEIFVRRDGTTTSTWNVSDQVIVGNSMPKYRGNIGFNGEYKGFGLSVVANFLTGGDYYNTTLINKVENVDLNYNVDRRLLTGRWTDPGQDAAYIRLRDIPDEFGRWGTVIAKTKPTSRFVQERSELHISSVSAYYNFNKALIQRIGLERLKVMVNLNDIHTFSTIKIERGTYYPFARSMSISINATF